MQPIWFLYSLVLGLLEISRHNVFRKLVRLVDTEGFAVWLPRDNVFVPVTDNVLKHNVKLERKRKLGANEELSDFR